VDALVIHLVTLLHQAGQVGLGPDLLHRRAHLVLTQAGVGRAGAWDSGQEAAAVPGQVLEDEGGHHGGHDAHQEVLEVAQAEFFSHAQEPLDVLGIGRGPGELGLGPVLGHPPAQGLEGDHADPVGGHQVPLTRQGVTIDMGRCGDRGRGHRRGGGGWVGQESHALLQVLGDRGGQQRRHVEAGHLAWQ